MPQVDEAQDQADIKPRQNSNLPPQDLHTLRPLIESLGRHGDRPAVIALQGEGAEEWSYARLAEHVRRVTFGLAGRGIGADRHVALLAGNRPEWVAACLAVVSAGAVPVLIDVQLREDLLRHVLRDSAPRLIFTTSDQLDRLHKLDLGFEPILLDGDAEDPRSWKRLWTDQPPDLPRPGDILPRSQPRPDDVAVLFYTSGTTGPPKGVPLTHANVAHQLNVLRDARLLSREDRLLLPLPLHHIYPFVMGMLAPLLAGMPIVMPKSLTGPQVVRALREGEVTIMIGVPRLYRALYDGVAARARAAGRVAAAAFRAAVATSTWLVRRLGLRAGKLMLRPVHRRFGPDLRLLASGGAALDEDLAWKLQGLGWRLATGYGLTETSPLLTLDLPESAKPGTVGRPIAGVEIRIDTSALTQQPASPDDARPRGQEPRQEEGEVLARGPSVFKGYRNLPDKTRESFTGEGFFRSGDLGRLDADGYLRVTGRVSTMIVTEGGKHVQPDDLEEIYAQSPVIRELAVLQKDKQLVAVVVPETAELHRRRVANTDSAVREAIQEAARRLPSYQHLTDYAVTRDVLPRTRLGKIRRGEIEQRYERAKAGEEGPQRERHGAVAPEEMSAEDRALLENPAAKATWDWLAGRYPGQRLAPDTNVQLELGVDSLEWLNLTLEIGQRTGVELTDEAIGNVETMRDLLREMSEAEAGGRTPGAPGPLERPEEALSDTQMRWLDPLTPALAALARWGYALVRAVMGSTYRLQVKGRENLPSRGPFVLTPNHNSLLDPLAVAAALDEPALRQIYWAGATDVMFRSRILRLVSRLAQVTPVDPRSGVRSSLAFAAAVLKRGRSLVWFAEGQRSPSGQLQPFKPGIGMLLERYPVPVVPVFIHGTHEALPPGSWLPHRRQVTVAVGAPLDVGELEQQGQGESPQQRIANALHDRVAELEPVAAED